MFKSARLSVNVHMTRVASWQPTLQRRVDASSDGTDTKPQFDFSVSQSAHALDVSKVLSRSSSSQLRNSFDYTNASEEDYGIMSLSALVCFPWLSFMLDCVGALTHMHVNANVTHKHRFMEESDDMLKIRRNSLNTQMGPYRTSLTRQHSSGSSTSRTDQMTTKLLVAVSDSLWQCVLQGREPAVIANAVEFEDSGSRPEMLDLYDFDRFAKTLHTIRDGGDESPAIAAVDEVKRGAHQPRAVQEAMTWQV